MIADTFISLCPRELMFESGVCALIREPIDPLLLSN